MLNIYSGVGETGVSRGTEVGENRKKNNMLVYFVIKMSKYPQLRVGGDLQGEQQVVLEEALAELLSLLHSQLLEVPAQPAVVEGADKLLNPRHAVVGGH